MRKIMKKVKINCTMWRWGIPIYWKDIYVAIGESIQDYNMGWWWDFMWNFADESQQAIFDFDNYEQFYDEKQNKCIIRRKTCKKYMTLKLPPQRLTLNNNKKRAKMSHNIE
jgi:hypothetical protein